MAKGQKVMTVADGSDAYYMCAFCEKKFMGTEKSVEMRFRMHCKKEHGKIPSKIDWPKHGRSVHYDKSQLETNKYKFSSEFVDNNLMESVDTDEALSEILWDNWGKPDGSFEKQLDDLIE